MEEEIVSTINEAIQDSVEEPILISPPTITSASPISPTPPISPTSPTDPTSPTSPTSPTLPTSPTDHTSPTNHSLPLVDYDTIVLSGGSVKGLLTLGSLQYALDNYLLKNVNTYIGTSSGAMTCYLMAIGYTPIEILVELCTRQVLEKMQHPNIIQAIRGGGALSFLTIQEQLEKLTIEKIGTWLTLGELKERFGKTLICVTHNLSKDCTEYLGPDTHPNLACIAALKMSSNLPLVFEKFLYNGSYYIDGGISDNFAVTLGTKLGQKVLGMLVSPAPCNFPVDAELDMLEYVYKLIFIPIAQTTKHNVESVAGKCKIITLEYDHLKFFNFVVTSQTKLEMFSSGYAQAKEQLI